MTWPTLNFDAPDYCPSDPFNDIRGTAEAAIIIIIIIIDTISVLS